MLLGARDYKNRTVLHVATWFNSTSTVLEYLIHEMFKDPTSASLISAVDSNEMTALCYAVQRQDSSSACRLIQLLLCLHAISGGQLFAGYLAPALKNALMIDQSFSDIVDRFDMFAQDDSFRDPRDVLYSQCLSALATSVDTIYDLNHRIQLVLETVTGQSRSNTTL